MGLNWSGGGDIFCKYIFKWLIVRETDRNFGICMAEHIWGIFDLVLFKIISGLFGMCTKL